MQRIDHPTAAINAEGHKVFTNGDIQKKIPPTVMTALWATGVQEELIAIMTAFGIDPDPMKMNQIITSLKKGFTLKSTFVGLNGYFDGPAPPPGWLERNGSECPENAPLLDAYLNGCYGRGPNGRSIIKDVRGKFDRAWDHGAGVDPGRELGSTQGDAIRNITGAFTGGNNFTTNNNGDSGTGVIRVGNHISSGESLQRYALSGFSVQGGFSFDASRQVSTAAENRPTNVALLACIYAGNE
jgi:hypothetical protein